ncbi:hypothetical protein ACU8KH_04325 [Lachancea thermotolerans]
MVTARAQKLHSPPKPLGSPGSTLHSPLARHMTISSSTNNGCQVQIYFIIASYRRASSTITEYQTINRST